MQASVYRLRDQSIKLPRPTAPRSGELLLARIDWGEKKALQARLTDGTRDLLPPLFGALITRVTRNGMVIQGSEMVSNVPGSSKARVSKYQQTWWAMVMCNAPGGFDVLEEIADGENPLISIPYPDALPRAWERPERP